MYSNNKLIRDVAAVAAQIMSGQKPVEEELKGGQKKIDKNHNNKIDSQDFAILRGQKKANEEVELDEGTMTGITLGKQVKNKQGGYNQDVHHKGKKIGHIEAYSHRTGMRYGSHHDASGDATAGSRSHEDALADLRYSHAEHLKSMRNEEVGMNEEDAYSKDRYAVKNGKATKDNPTHMGSPNYKDQPHHVWATSPEHAVKKYMKKEEVEQIEEMDKSQTPPGRDGGYQFAPGPKVPKKDIEAIKKNPAKHLSDLFAKEYSKKKVKEEVEQIEEKKYEPEPPNAEAIARKKRLDAIRDRQEEKNRGNKSTSNVRKVEGNRYGGAKQKDDMDESVSFTSLLNTYREGGLKPFLESLSKEEEEQLIDDLSKEIADETMDVINAGDYAEVTIGEEADTAEFAKDLEVNKAKASGKAKQPNLAKGDVMAVKNEEVEIEERHMTDAEMDKREKIVKSMKKGLSGFKQRYGDKAKNVMYATATKQAMK